MTSTTSTSSLPCCDGGGPKNNTCLSDKEGKCICWVADADVPHSPEHFPLVSFADPSQLGVRYNSGRISWLSRWKEKGRQNEASFSVKKFGYATAYRNALASKLRKRKTYLWSSHHPLRTDQNSFLTDPTPSSATTTTCSTTISPSSSSLSGGGSTKLSHQLSLLTRDDFRSPCPGVYFCSHRENTNRKTRRKQQQQQQVSSPCFNPANSSNTISTLSSSTTTTSCCSSSPIIATTMTTSSSTTNCIGSVFFSFSDECDNHLSNACWLTCLPSPTPLSATTCRRFSVRRYGFHLAKQLAAEQRISCGNPGHSRNLRKALGGKLKGLSAVIADEAQLQFAPAAAAGSSILNKHQPFLDSPTYLVDPSTCLNFQQNNNNNDQHEDDDDDDEDDEDDQDDEDDDVPSPSGEKSRHPNIIPCGIHYVNHPSQWVASFRRHCRRHFSIRRFGYDLAYRLACQQRLSWELAEAVD